MNIVSDFKFELNKNKIITSVQSYCETPPFKTLSEMYDNLLPLVREYSKPMGIFKLDKKTEDLNLDLLENCKFILYCAVTLGKSSSEKIDDLFNEGKFFEAILFDSMTSSYLFDVSSQLFREICEKAHDIGLGLTRKIAPGDGEIGLEYQKEIVNKLQCKNVLNLSISNGCLLSPSKSMSYVYGADESLILNQQKDHSCDTCFNTTCSMRNTSESNEDSCIKKIGCA
ncbi:5-methyltetrahydrofolate--homocysteine methyltransferase [Clostridium sp. CX1]|uniref:5-methyltetrahydrofolate--homocysteine methyltransferase n=1 Tax=Clostridium sp. CX1 TaxID=2978346 RepID=UPI0021C2307D|nr:5-methyltetrahydrofolate--homocysteine methyltransferase [Clostridium sp. CX1]MCT8977089.1 5-methyltetrahydrofolate--homocysteine methyltransferase [Clostridium sp. CX1]